MNSRTKAECSLIEKDDFGVYFWRFLRNIRPLLCVTQRRSTICLRTGVTVCQSQLFTRKQRWENISRSCPCTPRDRTQPGSAREARRMQTMCPLLSSWAHQGTPLVRQVPSVSTGGKRIRSPGPADRHSNPAHTHTTMIASPSTRDVGLSTGPVSSLSSTARFK